MAACQGCVGIHHTVELYWGISESLEVDYELVGPKFTITLQEIAIVGEGKKKKPYGQL